MNEVQPLPATIVSGSLDRPLVSESLSAMSASVSAQGSGFSSPAVSDGLGLGEALPVADSVGLADDVADWLAESEGAGGVVVVSPEVSDCEVLGAGAVVESDGDALSAGDSVTEADTEGDEDVSPVA
ncbi:hypothetical protein [Streptomyces sp. NPDC057877]|uniref:hypothetical protein n=1 Tax=Streptomyces sp. NPDC057877 TaxID=3346269 RepID=UPI0036CEFCF8